MPEAGSIDWLPVDTILGPEIAEATDVALALLAAEARRIRQSTIVTISLLSVAALASAFYYGASGDLLSLAAAVGPAVFAFVLAVQNNRLWHGEKRWKLSHRTTLPPELPSNAGELLDELRAGTRHARYRRGQSGDARELPVSLLRGPFGPLILSSDSHMQALALWDWFGGDRLNVEVTAQVHAPATDLLNRLESPAAIDTALAIPEICPSEQPVPQTLYGAFNPLIRPDNKALLSTLKRAYPEAFGSDQMREIPHRSKLIVRTSLISQELLAKRFYRSSKDLRGDVIHRLAEEGIDNYGLSEDDDTTSDSWMEKFLARRGYPAIKREIARAEAHHKLS